MRISAMNSGSTPNLEQPTIETATMTRPNRLLSDWRISVLALVALWAVIYMAGLSRAALLDDADTVHAEAAREMLQRHDWVTLYANGIRYLEKAPLMYWGVATSYTLFGISEWSTRFPLMLGVLTMILSTYGLGHWALGSEGGFDSGLVLATALGPFLFTRFLIPDVAVGLWLTLTFWFFLISLEQAKPARWTCWGIGAMCALNVLTKGLIGLVFPIGAIGLYLLLTGNLRHLLKLRLVSSALVFLAIAAPWHILAALRNPAQGNVRGFLWFYFVNEHILRFLNRRVPRDYDKVPLLLFWFFGSFPGPCFFRNHCRKCRGGGANSARRCRGGSGRIFYFFCGPLSSWASSVSRRGRNTTRSRRSQGWHCWSADGCNGSEHRVRIAANGAAE